MKSAKDKFIASKMHMIKKEGIRGKKVPHDQMVAVALSYAKKKGYKV